MEPLHTGRNDGYQGYIAFKQSSYKEVHPRSREARSAEVKRDKTYTEVRYRITDESGGESKGMSWGGYNKLKKRLDIERLQPIYFVSIHCQQIKTGPLHDHYDHDSPWCFPVVLKDSNGRTLITRHDSGDWMSDKSDVPDFEGFITDDNFFGGIYDPS